MRFSTTGFVFIDHVDDFATLEHIGQNRRLQKKMRSAQKRGERKNDVKNRKQGSPDVGALMSCKGCIYKIVIISPKPRD